MGGVVIFDCRYGLRDGHGPMFREGPTSRLFFDWAIMKLERCWRSNFQSLAQRGRESVYTSDCVIPYWALCSWVQWWRSRDLLDEHLLVLIKNPLNLFSPTCGDDAKGSQVQEKWVGDDMSITTKPCAPLLVGEERKPTTKKNQKTLRWPTTSLVTAIKQDPHLLPRCGLQYNTSWSTCNIGSEYHDYNSNRVSSSCLNTGNKTSYPPSCIRTLDTFILAVLRWIKAKSKPEGNDIWWS